jgi:hypothetical protein
VNFDLDHDCHALDGTVAHDTVTIRIFGELDLLGLWDRMQGKHEGGRHVRPLTWQRPSVDAQNELVAFSHIGQKREQLLG